ncbi:hypothetical protein [Dokdonia sp.]|uniref:hypothetical protein n=1 Tax=Dokdonia sp. TaxID=2024995 RepID=UPI0032666E87
MLEDKLWDLHSRGVPEDGYNMEEDLKWVIGEDFIQAVSEFKYCPNCGESKDKPHKFWCDKNT